MNTFDDPDALPARAPSPGIAAVLSFLIPGLGQLYTGRILAAAAAFFRGAAAKIMIS